jgi:hypothetical protein
MSALSWSTVGEERDLPSLCWATLPNVG